MPSDPSCVSPRVLLTTLRSRLQNHSSLNCHLPSEHILRQSRPLAHLRLVFLSRSGVREEEVATEVEPVDEVEDEEEDGHGDEEEAVHVDVVLPADVPRRLPPETALHGAASPEKWGKSI